MSCVAVAVSSMCDMSSPALGGVFAMDDKTMLYQPSLRLHYRTDRSANEAHRFPQETMKEILGWMPQIALFAAAPAPSRGVALASLALMLLQLIALVNSQLSETSDLPPIPSRESVADIDLSKFGINDEQKLFRYLLKDYDKAVRPVFNASKVVKVYIGLTLTHIFNIVSSFFDCSA
ncbi:unnamed protein product [Heligmosomoides polygyrus]|uniref:Neur_chan_LBD domain-containing protein n=1 Tax=Heligmosomoides polygyrus TaxID=6339 RepID=A0A3P8AVU4_HELPZ|nr:unnamed protein product [Heligmosomoides polygyrus]